MSFLRQRFFNDWKLKQLAFREYARRENACRYNRQRGFIINPYSFGVGAPTDPDFASVISLAHMDGTNGDTGPFPDQIANRSPGWTRSAAGPVLDTNTKKYGTAGLSVQMIGAYNASHADWNFVSGALTVEYWFNLQAYTGTGGSISYHVTKGDAEGNYSPFLIFNNSTTYGFLCSGDGATWGISMSGGSLSLTTWYHGALCRSGNSFYGWLSGSQIGSTGTMAGALMTNATNVVLGNNASGLTTYGMNGFIDDERTTKGVARYTSSFTPSATAFPDS